jgi:hypothetical protein
LWIKPETSIRTGAFIEAPATPLEDLKVHIIIQMLRSEKLPPRNLQMWRLMLPKVRVKSQSKVTLPLQKGSTAWIIIYASIVAN